MMRLASLLRATTAVLLAGAVLILVGLPVCSSAACPMAQQGKMDRALCRAMGLDCCSGSAGRVSHGPPQLASPALAVSVGALGIAPAPAAAGRGPSLLAPAAPAVIQGVGLHTLLAVFRI